MEIENIFLISVGSTNEYAKEHVFEFDNKKLTCIFTQEQTAGYGSRHHKWICHKGKDLAATFFFSLPTKTSNLNCLSYIMCISLCQVLMKYGLTPKIKWPNDILLSGKKLSGILCETKNNQTMIFLGIGINVNSDKEDVGKIDQPATSLKIETGHNWDIKILQQELQEHFLQNLNIFKDTGFATFHKEVEKLLAKRGDKISFEENGTQYEGTIKGITKDGYLTIILKDGTVKIISSIAANITYTHIN
jgi:BirA family biotin operon repressor/biotin-[acetyl-CoA-carboxylase] ligase